ncbi:helix-turn-helix transcriptional regulator [Paenibacillus polysaccharolyticus]|uniref:helix-turn-helix domain-containing protein n=1 Tax=Paenibacillus polysaccharolyticus TaxID=582692 RepID=UPI00203D5C19|nr:helix-turn-helix transcriptional regulator [Paenibacillus polysaccharolyticus]
MIKSNLKHILDSQGNDISIRELARELDCQFETIRRFYNDTMERYPRDLIDKLCKYLNVTPGQLLVYVPSSE